VSEGGTFCEWFSDSDAAWGDRSTSDLRVPRVAEKSGETMAGDESLARSGDRVDTGDATSGGDGLGGAMRAKRTIKATVAVIAAIGSISAGAAWAAVDEPLVATRVEMTIDGHSLAVFSRCIISSEAEVGAGSAVTKSNEVRCDRGLTRNIEISAWHELVILGDVAAARKSVSITMYNSTGDPVARWHLTDAYPSAVTNYFDPNGLGRELATFKAEFIQRVAV
jgi:hypothetical protein